MSKPSRQVKHDRDRRASGMKCVKAWLQPEVYAALQRIHARSGGSITIDAIAFAIREADQKGG